MTWTYNRSPGTSSTPDLRDAVRLLIGDTDTADQQVADEEIYFALDQNADSPYLAAAMMARAIAGKYARLVDVSVDAVRTAYSQRQTAYQKLSVDLTAQASASEGFGPPSAGGLTTSGMDSVDEDTDRITPAFRRGQFENPSRVNGDADDELT